MEMEASGSAADDADAAMAVQSSGSVERSVARPHLRVLPPAANWYCSQVCDWGYDTRNERWLIMYGAKNEICIYEFNAKESPVDSLKKTHQPTLEQTLRTPIRTNFVALLPRGKKDGRVTALRCFRDADGELRVVCGGEEGAVQIWDPVALKRVDQHRKHNNAEISAVSVRSDLDPNWIVAGDRQGVISVWQRDTASVQTFTPLPRDAVFSMDISPHDKTLVAVGYRSGALCVVDAVDKSVRYRLDGHDLEVQAAVWAPRSATTQYLATASRDRSIKVWAFASGSEEGEVAEPTLCARLEVRKPQQASSHSQSTRLWLPLAWTSSSGVGNGKYGLWSGSFEGNLQLFLWNGVPRGTVKPSLVAKNGHNRLLFGIVPMARSQARPPSSVDVVNEDQPPLFATISLDRDLCVWREPSLAEKTPATPTCEERIPAQGGFVYSLDFNHARKLLACGVGDQTIRLWNLTAKHGNNGYHSELVWKGLQSKITGVQWHPIQDHILAFGTEDGRVGVWDLKAKTSQRLKVNHTGAVYHIAWTVHAPATQTQPNEEGGEAEDDSFKRAMLALANAQADGQTLEEALEHQVKDGAHQTSAKSKSNEPKISLWTLDQGGKLCCTDAEKLSTIDVRKDCAAFAWNATFSSLAVGLSNGKVEIWKPASQSAAPSSNNLSLELCKSIHEHKDAVTEVAWRNSAQDDDLASCLLASSAKSGEILVYEVDDADGQARPRRYNSAVGYGEDVVAVLRGHRGTINCLRWNEKTTGQNEDLLASCGDDSNVFVWEIATQTKRASFTLHAGRVFSVAWMSPTMLASGGQDQSIRLWDFQDHPPKVEKQPRETHAPSSISHIESAEHGSSKKAMPVKEPSDGNATAAPTTTKPTVSKSKGKKKAEKFDSLFSDKSAMWMLREDGQASSPDNLLRSNCREGIAAQRKSLEEAENWDQAAQVLMLEGRIGEALQLVARHGSLSDAWVAYAPMAGQDVWREVSHLYAVQLQKDGDFKRAALQFLAIGKVESAVQCLVAANMYPEALSLIHLRLGPRHILLEKTLWEYADKLAKKNQHTEAARAYLSIGSTEARVRAIMILASTGKLEDAKQGMKVWAIVVGTTEPNESLPNGASQASVPTSVFMSILTLAVSHRDFELAEETLVYLRDSTDSASPKRAVYKLAQCVVRVASVLKNPQLQSAQDIVTRMAEDSSDKKMHEAGLLLETLRGSGQLPWSTLFGDDLPAISSSQDLWSSLLLACQDAGLWFSGSELTPDEVVEQLGDEKLFAFMLSPGGREDIENGALTSSLLQLSQRVLKFLAELMSGYLLSALEALRDLLSSLSSSSPSQIVRLWQLFPSGLLELSTVPAFGELLDEAEDTQALWAECFLLQCDLTIQHATTQVDEQTAAAFDHIEALLDESTASSAIPVSLVPFVDRLQHQIDTRATQQEALEALVASPSESAIAESEPSDC